jgi:hypothetical protein
VPVRYTGALECMELIGDNIRITGVSRFIAFYTNNKNISVKSQSQNAHTGQ